MFGTAYESDWAHHLLLFLTVSNILFCLQKGREQEELWVKTGNSTNATTQELSSPE